MKRFGRSKERSCARFSWGAERSITVSPRAGPMALARIGTGDADSRALRNHRQGGLPRPCMKTLGALSLARSSPSLGASGPADTMAERVDDRGGWPVWQRARDARVPNPNQHQDVRVVRRIAPGVVRAQSSKRPNVPGRRSRAPMSPTSSMSADAAGWAAQTAIRRGRHCMVVGST